MKTIQISDEIESALNRLAATRKQSPQEVLASLLNLPSSPEVRNDPLISHLLSPDFTRLETDADRYIGLLGWVAARHDGDFREFVLGLTSGRRFVGMTRDEIVTQCRHNQARPIPGTPYWAIMNLDTPTKQRFLGRLLEFVGYRSEVISFAGQAFGRSVVLRPLPGRAA